MDIETLGWTKNKDFFEVKVNMPTAGLCGDEVRPFAGLYCYHYSGEFSGCQFTARFVMLIGNTVCIHPCHFDPEESIDEPFEVITLVEYNQIKAALES